MIKMTLTLIKAKMWIDRINRQGTYTDENNIDTCTVNYQGATPRSKSIVNQDAQNAIDRLSHSIVKEGDITVKQGINGRK